MKQNLLKAAIEMTSPEQRPSWSRPWARPMTLSTNSLPVFRLLPVTVTTELRRKVDRRLRHWQMWASEDLPILMECKLGIFQKSCFCEALQVPVWNKGRVERAHSRAECHWKTGFQVILSCPNTWIDIIIIIRAYCLRHALSIMICNNAINKTQRGPTQMWIMINKIW